MTFTTKQIGTLVRSSRKKQRLTQVELASLAQVGPRFIGELEKGKETLAFAKVLQVFNALGIELTVKPRNWKSDG